MLTWEAAYATAFQIQVSATGTGGWTTVYSTTTGTGGTQTLNVSGTGRYVRMNGTARSTPYGYSLWEFAVHTGSASSSDPFWGDTSTIPPAQNVLMVKVLNKTNGHYPDSQVYWSFNGQTHSIAEQPYVDMTANSAGRMYFYLGSPTGQYKDFIEFTVGPDVFNGNTTRVDGFGLKLALRLHGHDGYDTQVGEDQATFAEDRTATFQRFVNEVPTEFKHLARCRRRTTSPSPGGDSAFRSGGQYANYFTSYAQSVGVNEQHVEHHGLRRLARHQRGHVLGAQPARRAAAAVPVVGPRASSTRPPRPTTTPSSGTTTPSTTSRTASRTTTTRDSPRSSPTVTRSTCWSPSAGSGPRCAPGHGRARDRRAPPVL